MLVAAFPAGSFQTNCYVVAPAAGEQCVVIDPGQDAAAGVDEIVREHRLQPVAVLLTHGHLDHMWSVTPVCGAHGIPAYVHKADRELLTDPGRALSAQTNAMLAGLRLSEPDEVREITDGGPLEVAGLRFSIDLTPGHTAGSVTFGTADGAPDDDAPMLFAGDLLFAGSVGRTDLPTGDPYAMRESLRQLLRLADETLVLPGHGDLTTIGRERATNPYLQPGAV
ncbi:MAG: hydroxyacylglutathione hydrolase [Frankiales bacterium]|nr:hydroxyacylglutathione hydrolase [Frankiales bacterium]MDX6242828.1 hydroxyacylglutathione hydrolase [Frankiales bacterium]